MPVKKGEEMIELENDHFVTLRNIIQKKNTPRG